MPRMSGGNTPASMPTPNGIEVAKLGTAGEAGKDEHALYVRSEWRKFQQQGSPLQRLAASVVPAPRSVLDVGCGAGQGLIPWLGTASVGGDFRHARPVDA